MLKFSRLIIILSALALFGASCIRFGGGGGEARGGDGGVYKSVNRGEEWAHAVTIPTAQGIGNFGGANVTSFAIDPQDHKAIYAGTDEAGVFYSYDAGESWRRPADLTRGFVAATVVDPKDKCTVYVATANRILKSTDCNRTFQEVYREPAPQTFVTALAINPVNPAIIHAGTVKGTMIRSRDGGATWALEYTFSKNRIIDIILDPRNPAHRFVALKGKGVWRTDNDGQNYTDLSEPLREFKEALDIRRLIAPKDQTDTLLLAAKYKILKSVNRGTSWQALPIVSPETVEILSFTVNPEDSKELYYGTATTFYRSVDGGQSWSTKKLPTSRIATALMVDYEEPNVVYLGVTKLKE